MRKPDLISVLTPTYNRAKYLALAIESVQKQRKDGFEVEHIIVDNGSSDGTEELVKDIMREDPTIKYFRNSENLGPAAALNSAFSKSEGKLVTFLDDDDLLPLNSIKFRYNYFKNHPSVHWVAGYIILIDEENKIYQPLTEFSTTRVSAPNLTLSLLAKNFIPAGSVMVTAEAIENVDGWNPELRLQDFDLSLRLADKGYEPHIIDSYVYLYRWHKGSVTHTNKSSGIFQKEYSYFFKKYNTTQDEINALRVAAGLPAYIPKQLDEK